MASNGEESHLGIISCVFGIAKCRYVVFQGKECAKRVTHLIILGISDNQEIADILRSSITTIYTYRSKLKARAVNKDSFEDDVRKIATY
jgi:hypothetical protein